MIARKEEKDQAVFRVGEPEEGLLRCTGQLAMGTLTLNVSRINFHVKSLGVAVDS